jgi:hypothetical protein
MKKFVLIFISILFLIFPFVIWGNTYVVGGDDTRLYYVFPKEFLQNYSFNIISDNTLAGAITGYQSVAYFAPVFLVIWILKAVPVLNTQMLMYGINFALGFISFYLLMGLWIKPSNALGFPVKVLSSLFYILSPYLINTVYINQMLAMYLVSCLPLSFFLFIKGLREDKSILILLSVVIFSIFSSGINSLPWFGSFLICSLPLLMSEFAHRPKRFIKGAIIFFIVYTLCNVYWIFHYVYSFVHNVGLNSIYQYFSSSSFVADNLRIIRGVATIFNPLNVPLDSMNNRLTQQFSVFAVPFLIFFIVIILAPLLNRKITTGYLVGLLGFLLSWYLFSPGFGQWGPDVFIFLSVHVPFFTMFRDMSDKFGISLAFYYAFVFCISMNVFTDKIKNTKYAFLFVCILASLITVNALSLFSILNKQGVAYSKFSGVFPDDFTNLIEYLRANPNPSRIVWLPLNSPTYLYIQDPLSPKNYYSGLSPIRELANKSDIIGRFGFITQADLFMGEKIFQLLGQKDYQAIGRIYQQLDVKYIVEDKTLKPKEIDKFYFNFFNIDLAGTEGKLYKENILGKKISDFGNSYSLYEINDKYFTDKLYLVDKPTQLPQLSNFISYTKNSSSEYSISINRLKGKKTLVFLDPYYKNWNLYIVKPGNKDIPYQLGKNIVVFSYANGWVLDTESIKYNISNKYYSINSDGSINLKLRLYFEPEKYNRYLYGISLLTFAGIIIYGIYTWIIFAKNMHNS